MVDSELLCATEHHEAWLLDGYVAMRRLPSGAITGEELVADLHQIIRALTPYRTLGLLIDLRDARGNNDPEFEQRIAFARRELTSSHVRAAYLVRTAAGQMQLNRYAMEDSPDGRIRAFRDEGSAVGYVRGR